MMATLNSVQKSIHLPLPSLAPPRVLMCSASFGIEGSVSLQYCDPNLNDSNQTKDNPSSEKALANGYSEQEMLVDVFNTLQKVSLKSSNTNNNTTTTINNRGNLSNTNSKNNCNNNNNKTHSRGTSSGPSRECQKTNNQSVSTGTNTINKTNSYIKNCFIRSSSCSNTSNVASLAQIMSNSSTSNNSSNSSPFTANSNSNCSSNSNFSTSSNDSVASLNSNSNSKSGSSSDHSHKTNSSTNTASASKKDRPKISSPSRHGPQQCQICSKIFGNASALAKHKLTHSDERKFICIMCSKAFKRQDHLNGHMMTHRNKKPYECKTEGCGKSYCDARSLRRHRDNHHAAVITPQNQTLTTTAGPLTGLSLSPAKANGDASSPDGATCIRTYISTIDTKNSSTSTDDQAKPANLPFKGGVTVVSPSWTSSNRGTASASPKISVTDGTNECEGLTHEQLDLISKIMQQTKQTSAQVTVSSPTSISSYKVDTAVQPTQNNSQSRPRTWNMQLLNISQNVSLAVDDSLTDSVADSKDGDVNQQLAAALNPNLLSVVKTDLKPVECNLCHRKFKNVPALNGHMRLHGGYFKKDPESKKQEKKEVNVPPLQTASIGVRALIEEKIISKRSKDLNKDSFIVPAPPDKGGSATTTIRRTINDIESLLPSKTHFTNNIGSVGGSVTKLPAVATIKSELAKQKALLAQEAENASIRQQKTVGNVSIDVGKICVLKAPSTPGSSTALKLAATLHNATNNKSTSTDPKESTLIELLKRGSKIAVTAVKHGSAQATKNNGNCRVIIPADLNLTSSCKPTTAESLTFADGSPLELPVAQNDNTQGMDDIYTVTYTNDTTELFNDTDVYNVSDAEMLLQTVDSMQLLDDVDQIKSEHSDELTMGDNNCSNIQDDLMKIELDEKSSEGAISNADFQTDRLPTFQQFHSREIIVRNNSLAEQAMTGLCATSLSLPTDSKQKISSSMMSPMLSPLVYPTPPSSHENVTQSSSPYLEEGNQFSETVNAFFSDKCNADFLEQANVTSFQHQYQFSDEKEMKLRNMLEDGSFDASIKVEDLLNSPANTTECDLREFAETNLSFLNEDSELFNDNGNINSPLSESFFTNGMSQCSAEEVKNVLREVLPEETINLNCVDQNENTDIYFLPGVGIQQMMSNSEDPLLSSSPRDFTQPRIQQILQAQLEQQQPDTQQQQQQAEQQQHPQQQEQQQQHLQQQEQQQQFYYQQEDVPKAEPTDLKENGTLAPNGPEHMAPIDVPINAPTTQMHCDVQQLQQVQMASQYMDTANVENTHVIETSVVPSIIYTNSTGQHDFSKMAPQMLPEANHMQFANNPDATPTGAPNAEPLPPITTTVISTLQPLSNQTNSILKRRLKGNFSGDTSPPTHSYFKPLVALPYRSKLRKPSRTHYTPAPLLNPERRGVGLFCNIPKESGAGGLITFSSFEDDCGDPVGLVDFSENSKVNLGSAYQAQIPVCRVRESAMSPMPALDEQMWDPEVQTDEKILTRYVELSKSSAVPLGSHSEEVALQTLLKSNGNTSSAVLSLLQTQSTFFQMSWSATELEIFLKGLEKYGKDFGTIANELGGTKSTSDCVQMYYFWKKLCVDYKVLHLKAEAVCANQSSEAKPYVCELPDCSASFTSKAALHGHTRIHTYGRTNATTTPITATPTIALPGNTTACNPPSAAASSNVPSPPKEPNAPKDTDYPCKVCGKIFNKVKSRSAHMKTHRIQEADAGTSTMEVPQQHVQPPMQECPSSS